jgi:hypothetical protein
LSDRTLVSVFFGLLFVFLTILVIGFDIATKEVRESCEASGGEYTTKITNQGKTYGCWYN